VLYLTQSALAAELSAAMAKAGHLKNRGAKKRTDLYWLNSTEEPAVLLEVAFVTSSADADLYRQYFDDICQSIAETVSGQSLPAEPVEPPEQPAVPPMEVAPPTVGSGDRGSSVGWVQKSLMVSPIDGEFGPLTEQAVEDYQARKGLSVDGIVGPATWAQINADYVLPPYPPLALTPFDHETEQAICQTALESEIAEFYWDDRGYAPDGYLQGMALAYANMVRKLNAGDPVAKITAQADRLDPAHDVLSWYDDEFAALDMDNNADGLPTLRHLFVLMFGLGMRESSGRHCCGRDQSANNTDAETCEAGLFQMSWNASVCSTDVQRLFDEYYTFGRNQQSGAAFFNNDVECSQSEWACYGHGPGYDYQVLAKASPAFAVESTALVVRYLRQHFGPINRKEVQLRSEVEALLRDIEGLVTEVA
jgi:hypothetical protein